MTDRLPAFDNDNFLGACVVVVVLIVCLFFILTIIPGFDEAVETHRINACKTIRDEPIRAQCINQVKGNR